MSVEAVDRRIRANGVSLVGDGANGSGLVTTDRMPPESEFWVLISGTVVPKGHIPVFKAWEAVTSGDYMPGLAEVLRKRPIPTCKVGNLVAQRNALCKAIQQIDRQLMGDE